MINVESEINRLIREGALFVCNHSGGKDSQAMYKKLRELIPETQLIVIHAHLPEVEWEGVIEHINSTTSHQVFIVQAVKTFFQMVEHRKMWPSPSTRQCTSDLKRGPIQKEIRRYMAENGFSTVVNCMGLRAAESPNRAKKQVLTKNKGLSTKTRIAYDWLPIHDYTIEQVWASYGHTVDDLRKRVAMYKSGFRRLALDGWKFHWAYAAGMSRLSCKICIMASHADLKRANELTPETFDRYVKTERIIDHTFVMPTKKFGRKFLPEIIQSIS